MKTLVIGYGSTLRRDDGIGAIIAERLMDDPSLLTGAGAEVEVIGRQQLTPDLAEAVSQSDRVIFIDACAQASPGQVGVHDVHPKGENWGAFVHEMSPEVLLDCARELYHNLPDARLVTIGADDFSIGEGLTPAVEGAIPRVVDVLRQLIARRA